MKIENISLDLIKDNPYQTRENIEEKSLKILIRSIQERGLINPITLLKKDEEYIIINGHRRFEAYKKLSVCSNKALKKKHKEIPAIIKERNLNNELVIDLVHENLIREDLTPIEKGLSIKLLLSQIKSTKNDIDKMYTLINMLKNWKRRGHLPKYRKKQTECFEENDIFRLEKILKSIGVSENNAVTYLLILKLPQHMRRALIFNKRGIAKEGRIVVKQAENLVRVKDPKYQEYLFNRAIQGASVKQITARVNEHLKKVEHGDWEGFTKQHYSGFCRMKDDVEIMNNLSEQAEKFSAKVTSFKVDTLLKLEETFEKEEFVISMVDLKKQLELLLNRIEEKLEDKGYIHVEKEIDPFEVTLKFGEEKKHFRYTFPMKVAKKLMLSKNKTEFLKLKIVARRNSNE